LGSLSIIVFCRSKMNHMTDVHVHTWFCVYSRAVSMNRTIILPNICWE
jgi:hypothetical protein